MPYIIFGGLQPGIGGIEASPSDEEKPMVFPNLEVSSLLESICKGVLTNATDPGLFCYPANHGKK